MEKRRDCLLAPLLDKESLPRSRLIHSDKSAGDRSGGLNGRMLAEEEPTLV